MHNKLRCAWWELINDKTCLWLNPHWVAVPIIQIVCQYGSTKCYLRCGVVSGLYISARGYTGLSLSKSYIAVVHNLLWCVWRRRTYEPSNTSSVFSRSQEVTFWACLSGGDWKYIHGVPLEEPSMESWPVDNRSGVRSAFQRRRCPGNWMLGFIKYLIAYI